VDLAGGRERGPKRPRPEVRPGAGGGAGDRAGGGRGRGAAGGRHRPPERQRLAVFLRHYADLDYASIAEALEIAPGTVGATLSAAYSTLRTRLEEIDR
jgi:hypothetical protein